MAGCMGAKCTGGVFRAPAARAEGQDWNLPPNTQVAELLATAHREGHAWADMAILCRHHSEMDMCAEFLRKRKLPHQLRRNSSSVFDPAHDSIKVMTLHVSKGLEFPVVALVGAGRMPAEGEDEREEARLFYVGATRATQRLVIGVSGSGGFSSRIAP